MAEVESEEAILKRLYALNEQHQAKTKKKRKRKAKNESKTEAESVTDVTDQKNEQTEPLDIQYVTAKIDLSKSDPNYQYFAKIFDKFKIVDPSFVDNDDDGNDIIKKMKPIFPVMPDEDEQEGETKMSKRKAKMMRRIGIANLKLRVQRPEVVEMHDANSKEPVLLIHLKSYRNTVGVPKHWSYKRKYLQGKRGFVKPPFELPDYIKATGIMETRSALQERDDSKNLKAKMKAKIRPKLGKGEIDYQKMHDAFFKYQTKPRMTMHGDLYYEGKEFEVKLKQKKPGDISDDLRISLGMPVGLNKHLVPPPWLIAMQRYGPPPSYPNLKIPGLNAPIPEGATFGYHAGGWGKPPVDELGRPLYGDVFGTNAAPDNIYADEAEIDKSLWGALEVGAMSEEPSDQEMEDVTMTDSQQPGTAIVMYSDGAPVAAPTTSLLDKVAIEPLDYLELRKRKAETKPEPKNETPLYSIIPAKQSDQTKSIVQTSHVYDLKNKQDIKTKDDISEGEMDMEMDVDTPIEPVIKKAVDKVPNKNKTSDSKNKKNKDFKF